MSRPVAAARRYAEAAFQVALADDTLDVWAEDLRYAANVLGLADVEQIVDSPAVPLADRQALVAKLLEGRIQPGALRLVDLMVARGRVSSLTRVADQYTRLLNTHRGIVMATVTSAVPLTGDETAAIRARVEAMANARVELQTVVDPALIGGVTIQVRDQLLDASIRGRLERLRDQLHAGGRLR
ncbi:MAG: ATP synthase F1 subunit delta [Chloroflexota bacterium]